MNHEIKTLLWALCILMALNQATYAQLENLGAPLSWSNKIEIMPNKSVITMQGFDLKAVESEDAVNDFDKSKPWRFGYNYDVNLNMDTNGHWTQLPNGDRIWRLAIHAPGALSLNVIFDDFYIPKGARMDMYNLDRSHHIGSYTSILNNEARMLGTELVHGDYMIIEYYEPILVKQQGKLNISTITHGYRSLHLLAKDMLKNLNASGACNIDVLCPLGIGWENQIKSVGLIIVNGNSGCSGALINNTANDGRPFFLTANHCLGNPSNWLFRFDWHSLNPSCATTVPSGNGPFLQTSFTSTLRARSAGSDFALVELNNPLPQNWDVYYAGWDRTDAFPQFTVGIHHPAGDIKKICRDDDPATKRTSGGAQVWRISEWEQGVTEPGSSGSPLFDQNGRIIGQLYGGLAACISPSNTSNNGQYDDYGRIAISWNGNNAASRLSDWLDPIGSGISILDGFSYNQSFADWDVSILNAGFSGSTSCSSTISISPTIRNLGSNALTHLTFTLENSSQVLLNYDWTGNINPGNIFTIDIPSFSVPAGNNDISVSVTIGNGVVDENPDNNETAFTVQIIPDGNLSVFNLTLDCYGSENSFSILDAAGGVILSDGPFPDTPGGQTYSYEVCLAEGCYTMTLDDSYGDGLFGAQYNNCSVNGTYNMVDALGNILFQMTAPNGNFGSSISHNFCVTSIGPSVDFHVDAPFVCAGTTVQFTGLSNSDDISSWSWTFPGGIPSTSNDQNPIVFYATSGIYSATLEISDGNLSASYTNSQAVTVHSLPEAEILIVSDFGCALPCSGALTVQQTGGDHDFATYLWSNGATTPDIEGLCYDSTFSVQITDVFGCQNSFTIDVPNSGIFSAISTITYDCIANSYCVLLTISGGNGPFNYLWSDEVLAENERCDLNEGSYEVEISDADGCQILITFELNPISDFQVDASLVHETCPSSCDGSIILSGDLTDISIIWEDTEDLLIERTDLCPGTYSVQLTHVNSGCVETRTFNILESTPLEYTINSEPIHCNNPTTCASFQGDSIRWVISIILDQDTIMGNQICDLSSQTYALILVDNFGCQYELSWEPEYHSDPEIFASFESEICLDLCDGYIVIEAISSSPVTYAWSSASLTGPVVQDLCKGFYSVTITDSNGCTDTAEIEILEGSEIPVVQFEADKILVNLSMDSTIQFTNTSLIANEFFWNFGDGNFSTEVSPSHKYQNVGTYLVTLTGFNGACLDFDSLDIEVIDFVINTEDIEKQSVIKISPNPTSGLIFIDFKNIYGKGSLMIRDLMGNEVLKEQLIDPLTESFNINNLPSGSYIINWISTDMTITQKIIKQ